MKRIVASLALTVVVMLLANGAQAANKVVVIPLGGSDLTKADFANDHVWRGKVNSNGSKSSTGFFTSTKSLTGLYQVSLDLSIPGLDLSTAAVPGFGIPVVSIFLGNKGDSVTIGSQSRSTSASSGELISLSFLVLTSNAANVSADKNFSFVFQLEEPNPAASAATPNMSMSGARHYAIEDDPNVICRTEGDIRTCVLGQP